MVWINIENTNPMKFDKFYYLCHNCHSLIHQIENRIGYSQEENNKSKNG
jgi:predicted HNH restriction endonuclease